MAGLGAWLTGLSDEADVATEAGEDYGKKNKMATGDTAADAVRHMTMAALAVKEHPEWGATIMQAHETLGGGDQRAKRMDEYNNEMGIKAFLEIPEEYRKDMSNEEVAAYMTEIVDKEYQYRLKNDGKPSGEGPKFYEKPLVTDGGYAKGGEVTSAGRKVFQDEDGENYSEKTITFETKYGWVNMPTVDAEGEQKSQEWLEKFVEENGPVDPVTGSALDVFETVEQAVESAEDTTAKYAEEMSPEFNEGGLMAEDETGMPIVGYDEESGNPIPPGSSAENVRDDIPAMLSEGEFVVPADVVKWHGLKHMMEMREEAKEGLMAMHMEDQIKSPEHEVEEEEMMETSSEEMDEHGNEDYPTEMGQMSDIEYGDESLLVLMAADGGEVTSGEETTAPKQRLVRRLMRDPKTGKMIVMFVDIATGKPVARKAVQEGLADGTMETLDQTPQRMFEQMGGEMPDKSTAEEVVDQQTGVSMPSASSGGSGEGVGNSEPVQRTLENNYGFIDPAQRSIAMGVAGMIPGGTVLGSWGINANNTAAVNAAREELGLGPVDTTLGVNMDAATGMVTDQMDPSDDVNVGPFSADVMMTDQIGRTARVADPDGMGALDKIKDSKAARFFSGKNVTLDDTKGLPYETSSYLTPFEIQEKQAAGLAQDPTTGRWGYSTAAEQIGRETFGDMSDDAFGSDIGISTADEYGLSLATDRGRQEALGISKQDQELFDDNDDGKLDAKEVANMKEFYGEPTSDGGGGSMGLGYDSSYGSQAEADAVASDGWGSDAQFDAIDAQFDSIGSTSGGSGGNYDGGGSDTSDNTNDSMSFGSGGWDSVFNKGGYAIKKKQKYASIKK